jgi:hypothetical protein
MYDGFGVKKEMWCSPLEKIVVDALSAETCGYSPFGTTLKTCSGSTNTLLTIWIRELSSGAGRGEIHSLGHQIPSWRLLALFKNALGVYYWHDDQRKARPRGLGQVGPGLPRPGHLETSHLRHVRTSGIPRLAGRGKASFVPHPPAFVRDLARSGFLRGRSPRGGSTLSPVLTSSPARRVPLGPCREADVGG